LVYGTQNYTCLSSSSFLPAVPNGANAVLLDATPFLNPSGYSIIFNGVPSLLLTRPETFVERQVGRHYFNTPSIAMFDVQEFGTFQGSVFDSVRAPWNASIGSTEDRATDWLTLTTTKENSTLKQVYCVQTAGGKPPENCASEPKDIAVVYAAQCWFYGIDSGMKQRIHK